MSTFFSLERRQQFSDEKISSLLSEYAAHAAD
jgi:hypothetical protein